MTESNLVQRADRESVLIERVAVDDLFNLPVIEQPPGNITYVSDQENILTIFSPALRYGTQGIIAHNTLAGAHFFELKPGMLISANYNDGNTVQYRVKSVHHYQALSPESTTSRFRDLSDSDHHISSTQLFFRMYNQPGSLVFQTCIEKDGDPNWGRLFIITEQV